MQRNSEQEAITMDEAHISVIKQLLVLIAIKSDKLSQVEWERSFNASVREICRYSCDISEMDPIERLSASIIIVGAEKRYLFGVVMEMLTCWQGIQGWYWVAMTELFRHYLMSLFDNGIEDSESSIRRASSLADKFNHHAAEQILNDFRTLIRSVSSDANKNGDVLDRYQERFPIYSFSQWAVCKLQEVLRVALLHAGGLVTRPKEEAPQPRIEAPPSFHRKRKRCRVRANLTHLDTWPPMRPLQGESDDDSDCIQFVPSPEVNNGDIQEGQEAIDPTCDNAISLKASSQSSQASITKASSPSSSQTNSTRVSSSTESGITDGESVLTNLQKAVWNIFTTT